MHITFQNQLRVLQSKNITQNLNKPQHTLENVEVLIEGVLDAAGDDHELVDVDSGEMRRRGRKKKKGNRVASAVLVTNTNDPETQVNY